MPVPTKSLSLGQRETPMALIEPRPFEKIALWFKSFPPPCAQGKALRPTSTSTDRHGLQGQADSLDYALGTNTNALKGLTKDIVEKRVSQNPLASDTPQRSGTRNWTTNIASRSSAAKTAYVLSRNQAAKRCRRSDGRYPL